MDCGSSMQPDIERIIALHPEALLISPFENSGGYGKLDKLRIPIIETADYMETSPLGRAEWIKLYGLLLGSSKADSLFSAIEKEYLQLKAEAAKLPLGLSILTERKTGNVWYVPGGKSTMGILLRDAHAKYIFADDQHSGSLSMSPEQIIAKGNQVDVWAFKYFGGNALTKQDLLAEYQGYQALKAFQSGNIYETDTSCEPYFELTSSIPRYCSESSSSSRIQKQEISLANSDSIRNINEEDNDYIHYVGASDSSLVLCQPGVG